MKDTVHPSWQTCYLLTTVTFKISLLSIGPRLSKQAVTIAHSKPHLIKPRLVQLRSTIALTTCRRQDKENQMERMDTGGARTSGSGRAQKERIR
ncbi:hypothetical protein RRG08_020595 [Elysia crispata]|uniref:Uncharacterized protein n=1 Tax=Elysia crispata TaxID=231223 RepID=A0AAE1DT25_9GAST|nr:hypothetical protein RRG08_020595 [Elysia crispata]